MYEQPEAALDTLTPRVFVIGAGVERVHDLRALRPTRAIRAALKDAGLLQSGGTDDGRLIGAACVDRVLQNATDHLPMPTFCVHNATLNAPKTLLLARQLIRLHGHDCVLALGLDRYRDDSSYRHDNLDIRTLITEFDHVQRRQRFAEHELWQQIERLDAHWLHDSVIVACLLANESFVRRHVPHGTAMEIRDMRLASASADGASNQQVSRPRMIQTLGFVRVGTGAGMTRTGLAHCALTKRRSLRQEQSVMEDEIMASPSREASENEILLAIYGRYEGEIKAKL